MPLLQCGKCGRIYADTAVVGRDGKPLNTNTTKWTDIHLRLTTYVFLYGPLSPSYATGHLPCNPSMNRLCTLQELQIYNAPVTQQPVPISIPTPILGTAPVHQKPTWAIPSPLPAANGRLTYGTDSQCQVCDSSNGHALGESNFTRWVAETIHQYLRTMHAPANPGFMIGVAAQENDNKLYVAFSSNTYKPTQDLNGCTFTGWKLKLYDGGTADVSTSRGGADIQPFYSLSMVQVGPSDSRSSANCAASKLAKRYIKGPLNQWRMTEIAYGNMVGYVDGQAAGSCVGCRSFLPTLLCNSSA